MSIFLTYTSFLFESNLTKKKQTLKPLSHIMLKRLAEVVKVFQNKVYKFSMSYELVDEMC